MCTQRHHITSAVVVILTAKPTLPFSWHALVGCGSCADGGRGGAVDPGGGGVLQFSQPQVHR